MLSAVGIVTKDMKLSEKFYQILGFNFESFGNSEHLEATLGSSKIILDSFELTKKMDPEFEFPIFSKISLCFEFETVADLEAKYAEFIENGFLFKKEPFDAFWNQRYAVVLDPSGNNIDLYCELGGSV